jgi:hypothetical protein
MLLLYSSNLVAGFLKPSPLPISPKIRHKSPLGETAAGRR